MAKIPGSLIEGIRGRLQALVGSRNASGNYIRRYAKPTNPNTLAQQMARNSFRSMSGGFNTLTQALRQGWQDFAISVFNPLRKTNKGQYTGAMAFKALRLFVNNANRRPTPFTATFDLSTPSVTLTSLAVSMPASPPLATVRPNIKDTATSNLPLVFESAGLSSAGSLTFSLSFEGVPAAGLTGASFVDENGFKLGVQIYISDVVKAVGFRFKNQFEKCIAFSNIIQSSTPTFATRKKINFTGSVASLIPNFKNWPVTGDVVYMTCVIVAENATCSVVGGAYVTLT